MRYRCRPFTYINPLPNHILLHVYLSLLRERVRDLLLGNLSLDLTTNARGGGLYFLEGRGERLVLFGEGLHLLRRTGGGDTEIRFLSLEWLLDFLLLSDLLFLWGLTDFLSLLLSPSLDLLLDLLLLCFSLSEGERLLDLFFDLDSLGERVLFLSLSLSLLPRLVEGEWLLFRDFFLTGDLLLDREDLLGDLDIVYT